MGDVSQTYIHYNCLFCCRFSIGRRFPNRTPPHHYLDSAASPFHSSRARRRCRWRARWGVWIWKGDRWTRAILKQFRIFLEGGAFAKSETKWFYVEESTVKHICWGSNLQIFIFTVILPPWDTFIAMTNYNFSFDLWSLPRSHLRMLWMVDWKNSDGVRFVL